MRLGSIVVAYLHSPREKIWGQLIELNPAGATVRGIDLNGFDDWVKQPDSEDAAGPATVFFPLYRIERISLDEPVGNIPSLADVFKQKTGQGIEAYFRSRTGRSK